MADAGQGRARGNLRVPAVAGAILLAALGASAADAPISPSVAALFVGEEKVVEGTVTAAARDTGSVHLTLGTPPQHVVVSLILGWLTRFPDAPDRYYLHKTVRVAGKIKVFRGVPEIIVRDPAHIVVVEEGPVRAASFVEVGEQSLHF